MNLMKLVGIKLRCSQALIGTGGKWHLVSGKWHLVSDYFDKHSRIYRSKHTPLTVMWKESGEQWKAVCQGQN
jgi:hypothetical protein